MCTFFQLNVCSGIGYGFVANIKATLFFRALLCACLRIYRCVYLWKKAYINLLPYIRTANWMHKSRIYFEIYTLCAHTVVDFLLFFLLSILFTNTIFPYPFSATITHSPLIRPLFMQESNNVFGFDVSQHGFSANVFRLLDFFFRWCFLADASKGEMVLQSSNRIRLHLKETSKLCPSTKQQIAKGLITLFY